VAWKYSGLKVKIILKMKTEKSVGVVHRFKSVNLKRRRLDPKPY
jgi:hypothetical protein